MIEDLVAEIVADLEKAADPKRAEHEKRYLKSELTHLGVGVPAVRRVAVQFARRHGDLHRLRLLELVETLWEEPVHELRLVGIELLAVFGGLLQPADLALVERLIRQSRTWALVDPLAITVARGLVARFDELGSELDRWAVDGDQWVRRAALLALLKPLREGGGDFERFGRYADAMLEESEFSIRKAIGWVLRDTSKKRPQMVAEWLVPRAGRASGVTVREAVKYLDEGDREVILAAWRG